MIKATLIITAIIALTGATICTYAADLTADEQQTAQQCLQFLEKYPADHMPAAATPVLTWCVNHTTDVCALATNGLTKDDCESKLDDWYTAYVPQPPSIKAATPSPVITTPTETAAQPEVAPSTSSTSDKSAIQPSPTNNTPVNQSPPKKPKKQKTPSINWY